MPFSPSTASGNYGRIRAGGAAVSLPLLFCIVLLSLLVFACSYDAKDKDDKAPLFVLDDMDGKRTALEDYRGKIVVLEFFSTWCEPCKITAPILQKIQERNKDRGVKVIGISIDEGPNAPEKVRSFMKEYRFSYTVVIDNGGAKKLYDAFGLPTTVIIDRNGRIRNKHYGITANYTKTITSEIEALMN
jgi:cytochrome c biogenesis protein CcmG/thiol:disulfide interchange protein DsbE